MRRAGKAYHLNTCIDIGPVGFNIFTIPTQPCFSISPLRSIGRLFIFPRLPSQSRLVMLAISHRIPELVSLGTLQDTSVASLLPHRQSAQPNHPRRYSFQNNPDKPNQSRVRVRVGPGLSLTLTLTSDSYSPTSLDNRTIRSSMRTRYCRCVRPFLTNPPAESFILIPLVSIAILSSKFRRCSLLAKGIPPRPSRRM